MGNNGYVQAKAYAKINLSLNIAGRRADGMHFLDSVMAELPLFDVVEVAPRKDEKVLVSYSDGRSYLHDNAVKSATAMRNLFGTNGVDIRIEKHIPEGAGFGGSSADGVAVIKLMQKLYALPDVDNDFLLSQGSDYPFMYHGGIARVGGVGEKVTPIAPPEIKGVAVWKNGCKSPTRDVFAWYDSHGGEVADIDAFISRGCIMPSNSLERSAKQLCGEIGNLGNMLAELGYPNIVMTGSGSAVIGYAASSEKEYCMIDALYESASKIFAPNICAFEINKEKLN